MLEVIARDWDDFLPDFAGKWERGDHVSIIAPTDSGKTNLVCHLAHLPYPDGSDRHVLGLDPKGGDSTLASTGWPRLGSWPPPRRAYDEMDPHYELRWTWPPWVEVPGKPARFIVGPKANTTADFARLRTVLSDSLKGAFEQGHWTVVVDELQIAADPRMMNLTGEIEHNLIAARDKGVSMVTLCQAPRRVPRAASDQAKWAFVSLSYDQDVVDRLAEQLGRPKPEIRGAIKGVGIKEYTWLLFSRNPRDPAVVTRPTKF